MDISQVRYTTAAIIFFMLFFLLLPPSYAREYYAFHLTGSDCTLCHSDPRDGSLNQTGITFQARGYRYPFIWKGIYFSFIGALIVFFIIFRFSQRYRLWHIGKSEGGWDRLKERWKGLLLYGFGHRRVLRSPFPGISHFLLFYSFFIMSLAIAAILIQEYVYFPFFKMRFINSNTYPLIRLVLDLLGMVGWTGTIFLAYRRYVQKPRELDLQWADAITLALLFFTFLTGFFLTGIRNQLYQSIWSKWAPMASIMAWVLTKCFQDQTDMQILFSVLWWVHLFLSFALLSYISFPRLFHLFASPLNIFFRNLEAKGTLPMLDLEASRTFGVEKIEEFTWKHLLELDACTRCGRCQEVCPAYLSQKHLNPKGVIQNLKRHMERSSRGRENLHLIGGVVTEDEIWECTTCRSCLEHCPVFIEPMVKLIEFRRNLVLNRGKIPRESRFAFRNIERKGNPWGFDSSKRMWWTNEIGVRQLSRGEEVNILFWVGCYSSYDDRNIKVATSLINILNRVGLDFGVLGTAEQCCGIDLRRMGSEYLYQLSVNKNIDLLQGVRFQKILTTCPHCFNTLKNEYPQFGATFEVIHYTSLLDDLIQQGKLAMNTRGKEIKITYHDSCYLGRYNDVYEPPRRIISAIPTLTFIEMQRNREKGSCCGGGGCHMWMEEKAGRRINEMRIEEAEKTGAEILATACPLCLISLDSAVKVLNLDKRIRVMDILELVGERIDLLHV